MRGPDKLLRPSACHTLTQGPAGEHILHPSASPLPSVLVQSEGMKLLNEAQILVFAVVMDKHMHYVLDACRFREL